MQMKILGISRIRWESAGLVGWVASLLGAIGGILLGTPQRSGKYKWKIILMEIVAKMITFMDNNDMMG